MASSMSNLPEMPSQLNYKPVVAAEMDFDEEESSRTRKVLQTLSALSAENEKKRSAKKQTLLKRTAKDKVSKFAKENEERLAASTARKDKKKAELMAKLRKIHADTTETWSRVDEFNRSVDQKSSYFKEDAERVEEEASDLLAHLRDARKQSDQMRVENEQSIVRTEIKNKLVQLETTMQEFVARNGEEDPTTKAMLLFSKG